MMESMRNSDVTAVRRRGGLGGLLLDGVVDENDQVCTDPKGCPQPDPLTAEAPLDADPQVCTDPKGCPQPDPLAGSIPQ
jgi:hypothetical protein